MLGQRRGRRPQQPPLFRDEAEVLVRVWDAGPAGLRTRALSVPLRSCLNALAFCGAGKPLREPSPVPNAAWRQGWDTFSLLLDYVIEDHDRFEDFIRNKCAPDPDDPDETFVYAVPQEDWNAGGDPLLSCQLVFRLQQRPLRLAAGGGRGGGGRGGANQLDVSVDGLHLFRVQDTPPNRAAFIADLRHHFGSRGIQVGAVAVPSAHGLLNGPARVTLGAAGDVEAACGLSGLALGRLPHSPFAHDPSHALTISIFGHVSSSQRKVARQARRLGGASAHCGAGAQGGAGAHGGQAQGGRGRGAGGRGGGRGGRGGGRGGAGAARGAGRGQGRGGGQQGGGGGGARGGRGRGGRGRGAAGPPIGPPLPPLVGPQALAAAPGDDHWSLWGYAASGIDMRHKQALDAALAATSPANLPANSALPAAELASARDNLKRAREANLLGKDKLVKRPAPHQGYVEQQDAENLLKLRRADAVRDTASLVEAAVAVDRSLQAAQGAVHLAQTAEGHQALNLLAASLDAASQQLGVPVGPNMFGPPPPNPLPSLVAEPAQPAQPIVPGAPAPQPPPAQGQAQGQGAGQGQGNGGPLAVDADQATPAGLGRRSGAAKAPGEPSYLAVRPEETALASALALLWNSLSFRDAYEFLFTLNTADTLRQILPGNLIAQVGALLEAFFYFSRQDPVVRSEHLAVLVTRAFRMEGRALTSLEGADNGGQVTGQMVEAGLRAFWDALDALHQGLGDGDARRAAALRDALCLFRSGLRFCCDDCVPPSDWQLASRLTRTHCWEVNLRRNRRNLASSLLAQSLRAETTAQRVCAFCQSNNQRDLFRHVVELGGDSAYFRFRLDITQNNNREEYEGTGFRLSDSWVPSTEGLPHLPLDRGLRQGTFSGAVFVAGRDPELPSSSLLLSTTPTHQDFQARHADYDPVQLNVHEVETFLRNPTPRVLDLGASQRLERDAAFNGRARGQARVTAICYTLDPAVLRWSRDQQAALQQYPNLFANPADPAHAARFLAAGTSGAAIRVRVNGRFRVAKLMNSDDPAGLAEGRWLRQAARGPGAGLFPDYIDLCEVGPLPAHFAQILAGTGSEVLDQRPVRALLMEFLDEGTLAGLQERRIRTLNNQTPGGVGAWTAAQLATPPHAMLTEAELLRLVKSLFLGLDHLHSTVGVVHRDIKPSNLGIRRDNQGRLFVVVLDLGLAAKAWEGPTALLGLNSPVGTQLYWALECWERACVAGSDVWAGAAVLAAVPSYGAGHPIHGDDGANLTANNGRLTRASQRDFRAAPSLPPLSAQLTTLLRDLLHPDLPNRPTALQVTQLPFVRQAY